MESGIDPSVLPGATTGDTSLPEFPAEDAPDSLYHKLPTAISFRLLEIVKVFPYLSCNMRTVSLADATPYHALSYCWGSPNRSVTLRCNGFKLKISPNLAEGLKMLHEHAVEAHWTSFWVDQICINQEDNAERTQQVRMMRSIYRRSTQTIVWIPLNNDIAKAAKDILAATYGYTSSHSTKRPPIDDKRWTALAKLLESPWFERCWILQEIAVSRGCPLLLFGDQQLSWSTFQEAIVWLSKSSNNNRMERMELVNSIQEVSGGRHFNESDTMEEERSSHLNVLLRLTNSFRSTDPRDKVFSLLGLTSAGRDQNDWPEELAPDYTRSVQEVYTGAAKYCIRTTDSLDILSQFKHEKVAKTASSHLYFPSWVPRWDLADSTRRISAFTLHWGPDGCRFLNEKHNRASQNTRVMMDQDTPLSTLRVLGLQIDMVNVCLPTVTSYDADLHAGVSVHYRRYLLNLIQQLYGMCNELVTDTDTSHSFKVAFYMVTIAGLVSEQPVMTACSQTPYETFLFLSQEWENAHTRWSDTDDRFRRYPATWRPLARKLWHEYTHKYIASLQRLMNRRLFITSSCQLGLGPASMMSGDTVAILFGGNVPYILRPLANNQWHFVGECYLDGYMDGEAMEHRDSSRDEWFEMV